METIELIKSDDWNLHEIKVKWKNKVLGHAIMDYDGFYYFRHKEEKVLWNENTLRQIADILKELNQSYQEHIENSFKDEK